MDEKTRDLSVIAADIRANWKNVSPYAEPYLAALSRLSSIDDNYYMEEGTSMVAYFLSNAGGWRGEAARRVKAELNRMLKAAYKRRGF